MVSPCGKSTTPALVSVASVGTGATGARCFTRTCLLRADMLLYVFSQREHVKEEGG